MTEPEKTEYQPSSVSPPGATLLDLLEERQMTQAELAKRLGLARKTVNGIVKGTEPISPTTALQMERALGTPAQFWLAREARYREHLARQDDAAKLAGAAPWLRELPVADMKQSELADPNDFANEHGIPAAPIPSIKDVEARVKEALEAGQKAAFIAAIEECQAYAEGLAATLPPDAALAFTTQVEDKVNTAKQIAMRIAQRAKR